MKTKQNIHTKNSKMSPPPKEKQPKKHKFASNMKGCVWYNYVAEVIFAKFECEKDSDASVLKMCFYCDPL